MLIERIPLRHILVKLDCRLPAIKARNNINVIAVSCTTLSPKDPLMVLSPAEMIESRGTNNHNHAPPSNGLKIIGVALSFTIAASSVTFLRIYTRATQKKGKLNLDDYIIIPAMVSKLNSKFPSKE
jgi:hypothetical protein